MTLIHLVSLITSPLLLDLQIHRLDGTPSLYLTTPSKNISFSFHSGSLYADSIPVSKLVENETITVSLKCISHISLHFATPHANSLIYSPSICSAKSLGLSIDETKLKGCVFDLTQSSKILLPKLCGENSENTKKQTENGPIYVGESVEVNEGGSMPLQWKNIYYMPKNTSANVSNHNIVFTVLHSPKEGDLRIDEVGTSSFTYAQLLARRVIYRHKGSESSQDAVTFKVHFNGSAEANEKTYTVKIKINSVNDAPEFWKQSKEPTLMIASKGSRVITGDVLLLTDSDDLPDRVKVQVVEAKGVHLEVHGQKVTEFTQRQLIDELVSIVDEGVMETGKVRLIARDGEARSTVVTLDTQSTQVEVKLVTNTGVRLLHHSSIVISKRNLTFEASIKEMSVSYRIVDLPDTGVVECFREETFNICTTFTQNDIDEERVRFRHTSTAASVNDMFSFQVEAGEYASMVHVFRIDFTPMNIKVFTREPFVLNATESAFISRQNLFAWTFPKVFSAHNLVYHMEEPPKLGTMTRKINAFKNRRVGVSSNFTQQDIDDGSIAYKLHYTQYSIVNDFFVFRVVSPAVSSALMRFDIVYVPRTSAIRLVNKTVVVKEGEQASITSDFLSLATPDENSFIFRLLNPPIHGQLSMKLKESVLRIKKGMNFTTEDILKNRVFYAHSDDESREDECRMMAISKQNKEMQVPLRLSFSIILLNDNVPRLISNRTIYIVERGERVLHRHLLPVRDDDIDSSALLFNFSQNKDAAILSTVSPFLPLTSFNQHDVDEGKVMIRHLGHHQEFDLKYSVSDGEHSMSTVMHVVTGAPNVWVDKSSASIPCSTSLPFSIRLSSANLSVLTNMDVRPSDVVYTTNTSRFSLGSTRKTVTTFTQESVEAELVWFSVDKMDQIEVLRVDVADRILEVKLQVTCEAKKVRMDFRRHQRIRVPVGGAVLIDKNTFDLPSEEAAEAIFHVIRHPEVGYLTLDQGKYSSRVSSFTLRDVISDQVHYVHSPSDGRPTNDSIELQIKMNAGRNAVNLPFTLEIDVFERNVTLTTSAIYAAAGGRVPITGEFLNVTSSENEEATLNVISPPNFGWITVGNSDKENATSLSTFTKKQLLAGEIWFVSDGVVGNDSVAVRACVYDQCTGTRLLPLIVSKINEKAPKLVRNELLRVNGNKAMVTNSHLDVEDSDTASNSIIYHISRPSNGQVVKADELEVILTNFTQFDIDQSAVAFLVSNGTTAPGGFSFTVTDGVHQIGPEWFATELASTSPVLESNGRLVASPSFASVIGAELLRANLPNTHPDDIIYKITKPTKFGAVMVDGVKADTFTQTMVNRRRVTYSTVNEEQHEWSRRDSFMFRIYKNNSDGLQAEEKFRITTTYAALNEKVQSKYLLTAPAVVSKRGSVCLNHTNLDVSRLVQMADKEVVMVAIGVEPRQGTLKWIGNDKRMMTWTELRSHFFLVYQHEADDLTSDSLVFHVYAAREATRRSSRIRVTLNIHVVQPHDSALQVVNFPSSVGVLNSGSTTLFADQMMTSHKSVPPQSIVYQVIQRGTNGVSIRRNGREVKQFTQSQVNDGEITVYHSSNRIPSSWHDVIVLDVEGHTRCLLVDVRPLDLTLKNHTVIQYPQGKTYVVLNRTHLGAYTNGNRDSLKYKITHGPENGTFYWVAGEKEAKEFTQLDIDEGRILYAQLNMHSYQDAFDFTIESDAKDVVRNSSRLRVTALIDVQPVIVEARTATPLTSSQINASALFHSSPRFFLTSPLKNGRLTFDPSTNYSTYYFTNSDIHKGIVFYQAFETDQEEQELVELEVRAENVQPSRFILPITILTPEIEMADMVTQQPDTIPGGTAKFYPLGDSLPIVILISILIATICILGCRKYGASDKKKRKLEQETAEKQRAMSVHSQSRLPPSPTDSSEAVVTDNPPDLLGTTVYASVRQAEDRMAMKSFSKPVQKPTGTSIPRIKPTSTTPPTIRRGVTSALDYAGLEPSANDAPPAMRLFDQVSQPQSPSHYWV